MDFVLLNERDVLQCFSKSREISTEQYECYIDQLTADKMFCVHLQKNGPSNQFIFLWNSFAKTSNCRNSRIQNFRILLYTYCGILLYECAIII